MELYNCKEDKEFEKKGVSRLVVRKVEYIKCQVGETIKVLIENDTS